ncbi:hypothetical protein [Tenacibaculum piscium]|uniref:hypothetical protein n=1 Tax=Tenacibaculum piscium TaxID=1458515 RepID=UPI001F2FCEC9|nr:hypothetical protein [Tenacibaculum piscium]
MKNTKQNIKKTGAFLADNTKEVLYISGGIVLLLVGYKIYKSLNKNIGSALDDKVENVKINVQVDLSKVTITKEDAQKYAQQLLNACNGAFPFYGTDEDLIKKVFEKLNNSDDFKLVYKAFGLKEYNGYGSPPTGVSRHLDNYSPKDLVYWLRAELSPKDGQVYRIVKNRIESANWTF